MNVGMNASKAPIAAVAINIPTPLLVFQPGVSYDLMYGRANEITGKDGYTWYQVKFLNSDTYGFAVTSLESGLMISLSIWKIA